MSGVNRSLTSAVTTAPNAAPMTTATARSRTFPRKMNCLKPLNMATPSPLCCGARHSTRIGLHSRGREHTEMTINAEIAEITEYSTRRRTAAAAGREDLNTSQTHLHPRLVFGSSRPDARAGSAGRVESPRSLRDSADSAFRCLCVLYVLTGF